MNKPMQDSNNTSRLPLLSIVVDDFDSIKNVSSSKDNKDKENQLVHENGKQTDTASITKLLEDANNRRQEFWKLIDEHTAVIENLKKIEKKEPITSTAVAACKKLSPDKKCF